MSKKKIIIISCIVVILAGSVFGAVRYSNHIALQQERQIRDAYWRVNLAHAVEHGFLMSPSDVYYKPFREIPPERNRWGIEAWTYLFLKFYELETGSVLSYETLIDYFSQEFEPDGSLRLYNNGNHPEIEAFIVWMWNESRRQQLFGDFINYGISVILNEYIQADVDSELEHWRLRLISLSPQMLDALVRAYVDPDYVLDLTSLQRAGY